jgi:hypothetical protein
MDYATQTEIHQIIVGTLAELGVPNAKFSIADTRILVRDGLCVGRTMVYGSIRVVLLGGRETIEFYDRDGSLLRVVEASQPVSGQGVAA